MGKKDAKQEHYQVEEKAQDELRYAKWSTSSDERSAECRVQSAERGVQSKRVGENEAFCLKGF